MEFAISSAAFLISGMLLSPTSSISLVIFEKYNGADTIVISPFFLGVNNFSVVWIGYMVILLDCYNHYSKIFLIINTYQVFSSTDRIAFHLPWSFQCRHRHLEKSDLP